MAENTYQNIKIDPQGRALIPKNLRKELEVANGDELVGWLEGKRLVLESRKALLERVQARYADIGESLADELIAERREEAARE